MFLRCITPDMAAILNSELIRHLPKDVYLAGGTAIALYFGHRLSIDLDLFTPVSFDSLELSNIISNRLKSDFQVTQTNITEKTLVINLNDTGFSLFTYPYPLLNDLVTMEAISIPVASQIDLSLMKLIAINQRGTCKDFIDLKTLIEANNYTFIELAHGLFEKYTIGKEMEIQLKKSLVYFDDAERDLNIRVYNKNTKLFESLGQDDWKATRLFFENFVKRR
ncbi:MAG: nucleotidyl transferase AbiEii/AbiGii toxin family protein [Deltaproteobacteria bacterium]|nr:nucleotidyl transferase AbiEii/AbiGii toxin family protein [Deltaproteobacteria bacterium]MBW1958051.1 nucleotidyl transferase AbiEii/AbiGii toxin family protein [Deltaproteobacteria bacterium]MBW2014817.1 nucleotidyl transferase AbiEii/AbiGii toxin family protein [Deltaproteobacteria bacterium]MBW2089165.1 nucleotidyl transferase AbiEii/AbiGii toxin family protein [Deltaproteobacteria bacterium]